MIWRNLAQPCVVVINIILIYAGEYVVASDDIAGAVLGRGLSVLRLLFFDFIC